MATMNDFFPEIEVSHAAAEAIARGLYAVAKVDGVHEREAALVASFWADVGGGAGALAELERGATITAPELSAALSNNDLRSLFLKTSYLLAWADGKVTDAERKIIAEFSKALGVAAPDLGKLEVAVKEYLLSHLSPVKNTDAVVAVAKKLGV
jgi:tellurite resistance protein